MSNAWNKANWLAIVALGACVAWQPPAGAATDASYSYRRLYELLYQFLELPEATSNRLRFAIRLRAPDGNAPPGLAVHIQYGKRTIPVPVDEFGLLDLPVSPQLAAADAEVVTNKTEAESEMGLAIVIRTPPTHAGIDIPWLLEGVRQVNEVMQARARLAPSRVPRAIGVTLKFAGATQGSVIVHGEGGDIAYRADEYNTVNLPLREDALPDAIEITELPLVIYPLFED